MKIGQPMNFCIHLFVSWISGIDLGHSVGEGAVVGNMDIPPNHKSAPRVVGGADLNYISITGNQLPLFTVVPFCSRGLHVDGESVVVSQCDCSTNGNFRYSAKRSCDSASS